jgi:hypothetical protein
VQNDPPPARALPVAPTRIDASTEPPVIREIRECMSKARTLVASLQAGLPLQLRDAAHAGRAASEQDPWEPILSRVKGRIGHDGVERIATAHIIGLRSPRAGALA